MARMAFAIRGYLGTAPCPDCGGAGWYRVPMTGIAVECLHSQQCDRYPTRLALEIVYNAFGPIAMGEPAYETLLDTIRHRIKHGWLICHRATDAAAAGALVYLDAMNA